MVWAVKLSFHRLELRMAHPWAVARSTPSNTRAVTLVELTAADGTTGLGEAAPSARYKESPDSVEAFLRQVDARGLSFNDIEGSMVYLDTLSERDRAAKCALNLALLDGAGKRARQPVHEMLGLGFRENQHWTSFTIGVDSPETVRQKTLEAADYPVLKLKLGAAEDRACFQALREAAPDKPARVDANEGWKNKEQALEAIEWIARDGQVQYVEQPLPAAASVRDWAWLKQRSPLPIFGDESFHLASEAAVAAECFHGVNVKLVKTGGLSGAIDALRAARKAGLKTMLGCMIETSLLVSAAAHLAELCDYLDLDGNLLITNDPFAGVTAKGGMLSFAAAQEKFGLCISPLTVCQRRG
jgi:L-Ala-D/L-Glu epimerase